MDFLCDKFNFGFDSVTVQNRPTINFNLKNFLLHPYTQRPGDIVSKALHPNGALHSYTVLNNGKPANGWSSKKYYPNAKLKQEENYSNGLLIQKINYDERDAITEHKIWNNRIKQLIDKPTSFKLPKPNVVTGYAYLNDYLQHLPAISSFIEADYNKDSLLQSFDACIKSNQPEAEWRMCGLQMSFSIYWNKEEVCHQWHCHCTSEELYWNARKFVKSIL